MADDTQPKNLPPAGTASFTDRLLRKTAEGEAQGDARRAAEQAQQQQAQQPREGRRDRSYRETIPEQQEQQEQDQQDQVDQINAQEQSDLEPDRQQSGSSPYVASFQVAVKPAAPAVRTLACLITHGMGEQVRFETCAQIAEAFVRGSGVGSARPEPTVNVNRSQLTTDGELLARTEVLFAAYDDQPETHVHIYEGYWAPLTEGKISLTKTLLFCFGAGWRGLRAARSKKHTVDTQQGAQQASTQQTTRHQIKGRFFTRWVFNAISPFPIKPRTSSMLFWLIVILLTGVGLAYWCEQTLMHFLQSLKTVLQAAPSTIPCNCDLHTSFTLHMQALLARLHSLLALVHGLLACWISSLFRILGLVLGGIYAYYFRYFIVEYMGDVVIYVASYKVSEFEEIRTAIQKTVLAVGKQIVAATCPPGPLDPGPGPARPPMYDGIIFVGHSLGSVITYDLVNALIVWDSSDCNGRHELVSRIRRLITFGSPLDKTAFLFRTQTSQDHHYREAMAGLMQPMIMDYQFRPFHWVNLFSHKDPVSGCLAYYDLPAGQELPEGARRVINQVDPSASTPVLAHTQYWDGAYLTDHLLSAMEGTEPPHQS